MSKILIAGDLLPTESNMKLFEEGKSEEIFGEELISLFHNCDYRIVNMEGPFTESVKGIDKSGPCLKASVKAFQGVQELHINVASLANNHIMDYGEEGLESTLKILKENSIKICGVGKNLYESRKPHIFECGNQKIGLYSCAEYEFTIATEISPGANPFDSIEIWDDIATLREQTDYVIVLYHGGKEYYRYPAPYVQKRCRKMTQKGADLVICQHSHCIGCMEEYGSGTILYGQGNFILDRGNDDFRNSGLLVVCDTEVRSVQFIPVVKTGNGVRLAKDSRKNKISEDFYSRSKKILEEKFVENNYKKFADDLMDLYMNQSMGMLGKAFSKLKMKKLYNIFYRKKEFLWILNSLRCEAHLDVFLQGVKNKIDNSRS